jgi:hypothetical protein
MRQALHIFRKDVRSLSIQIGTIVLLFIGHAIFEARSWPVYNRETALNNSLANLLGLLLPLGIFILIALLVFEEALPGDRQDWHTRPYRRWNLLIAKALFLLIFFNAPLFLSDCYTLGIQGFTVAGVIPHLLLRQVTFTVSYILPSFAIASLTATLAQFFLAWFCIVLGLIAELIIVNSLQSSRYALVSLEIGATFLITFAILSVAIALWQYGWRQTGKARVVAACVVFAYFPVLYGFSTLTRKPFTEISVTPFNSEGIHIAYESGPPPVIPREPNSPSGSTAIWFPLTVQGLAPTTLLRGNGWVVVHADGRQWPTPNTRFPASVQRIGSQYWQRMMLSSADFDGMKRQPVSVQTSWSFEVVSDKVEQVIHPDSRPFFMEDAGLCRVFTEPLERPALACKAGLDIDADATVRSQPGSGSFDVRARPSVWGLSPVNATFSTGPLNNGVESLAVIPRHKLAALSQKMTLSDIRFADYAAAR